MFKTTVAVEGTPEDVQQLKGYKLLRRDNDKTTVAVEGTPEDVQQLKGYKLPADGGVIVGRTLQIPPDVVGCRRYWSSAPNGTLPLLSIIYVMFIVM